VPTNLTDNALVWNASLGEFVNEDHSRMQLMLDEYTPGRYTLLYIPQAKRETEFEQSRPWAIAERQHGAWEIIRYLSETDMRDPAAVLAWLYNGDLARHRPEDVFARMELEEKLRRELVSRKHADQAEERKAYAAFLVGGGKDKKNSLRLSGNRRWNVS
jgi:hypothetical protein